MNAFWNSTPRWKDAMKPLNNPMRRLLATILAAGLASPALAFDLGSDEPITVSADSARQDDGKGIATYTVSTALKPRVHPLATNSRSPTAKVKPMPKP